MRGGRTKKILKNTVIALVLVTMVFGAFKPTKVSAYDQQQRGWDINYVTRHMGVSDTKDVGNTVEKAKAKYTAFRTAYNTVSTIRNKILNNPKATQADKDEIEGVWKTINNVIGEPKDAFDKIIQYEATGKAMLQDLVNGAWTITECTTWNGTSNPNPDQYTKEPMSYCAVEFNDDIRWPALKQFEDHIQKQDFSHLVNHAKNILARTGETLTQKEIDEAKSKAKKEVPKSALESCYGLVYINIGICLQMAVGWLLYAIAVIVAGILQLGGMLLSYVFSETVLNISSRMGDISAIGTIWSVFRDIANLSFIFLLLYVAVGTMLQLQSVNWKKTLVRVVIAAILINFSMFITKVIIDLSNLVALAFYNQLDTTTVVNGVTKNVSMADKFMDMLGIQGIFKSSLDTVRVWSQTWQSLAAYGIGTIVVMFITAFSFLAAAWLFLMRFAIIIILIIVSPLAFAARAFPNLEKHWSRWWDALIGQALFPPIYMLFIWVTVTIGTELFGTDKGNLAEAFVLNEPGDNSGLAILIKFVLIIVLLNAALALAKTQAGKIGGKMEKYMNNGLSVVEDVRRRTKGVGVRVGINAPSKLVNKGYKRIAAKVQDIYTKAKGPRTDENGKPIMGKTTYVAGKVARVLNAATLGVVGGVVGSVDRAAQQGLNALEKGRWGGDESLEERDKYYKNRERELKDVHQEALDRAAIEKGLSVNLESLTALTNDEIEALKGLTKATADMTTKELEEQKKETLMRGTFLATLSNSQFDNVLKSEKLNFTEQEKNDMKKSRGKVLGAWAKHPTMSTLTSTQRAEIEADIAAGRKPKSYGTFEEFIQKKKPSEIAEMPTDALEAMAERDMLTATDMEQVLSKGNLNIGKRAAIRGKVEANYASSQREIERSVIAAQDRLVLRYMAANPGVTKADALKKFKLKQVRITADDVITPSGYAGPLPPPSQQRQAWAEQYERMRRSYDFLTGTKGINF